MKKILCLIDALGLGGAERQMIGLASLLKDKGYIVSLAYYIQQDFYLTLAEKNQLNLIHLKNCDSKIAKIKAVHSLIKQGKYEVVIAYKNGPAIIGCILKMLGGHFKLIVSERNTNISIEKSDVVKFNLYRCADYIVPNSYSQANFINNQYPRLKRKVVAITNFTDINHFIPSNYHNNCPLLVLTVARIAKQKNVILYLNAVKKIYETNKNIVFKWYGDVQKGQEAYEKECRELVDSLGINDCFSFEPATKYITDVYQRCDVFCLPSIYEGYPNVICEAMSCGKPILCSRVCDNSYIVEEGYNGFLFNPTRVDDIVSAFSSFLKLDSDSLQKFGNHSREIAEKKFSEEVFAMRYISLIES